MNNDFHQASRKPQGIGTEALVKAIVHERPDLAEATFYRPGDNGSNLRGLRGHTLITEKEVFKAPLSTKTPADVLAFMLEYNVQQRMSGHGLLVPRPTHLGKEEYFFGMERINARHPDDQLIASMTPDELRTLAHDIAKTLVGMGEAFSEEELERLGIKKQHGGPSAEKIDAALKDPKTLLVLGYKAAFCRDAMKQYKERLAGKKMHMTHTDLHSQNIFVNPETKRLAAIIDFGYVGYTVPEIALIHMKQGAPLVCTEYTALTGEDLAYKDVLLCRLYYAIVPIADHVNNANRQGVKKCMKDIVAAEQGLNALDVPKQTEAKNTEKSHII